MFSHEEIPGTVVLKNSVVAPRIKISVRDGGSFPIAVHGGSPDFYWDSP